LSPGNLLYTPELEQSPEQVIAKTIKFLIKQSKFTSSSKFQ